MQMAEAPTALSKCTCTPIKQCRQCACEIQRTIQLRVHAARLASRLLPQDQRQCSECEQVKSSSEFGAFLRREGRTYCCNDCEEQKRHAWNAQRVVGPAQHSRARYPCENNCGTYISHRNRRCQACHLASKKKDKPAPKKKVAVVAQNLYTCIDQCGNYVISANTRCTTCGRAYRNKIAVSSETKVHKQRINQSMIKGNIKGLMYIGEEVLTLAFKCAGRNCGKPILLPAKCYACATGRKITLTTLPKIVLAADVENKVA